MNTPGRPPTPPIPPTPLGELPDPRDDDTAAAVVDAFEYDAAALEPTDRLAELRAAAAQRRRQPWLVPAAACAAMVVVAGAVALATRPGDHDVTPPAVRTAEPSLLTAPQTAKPTTATSPSSATSHSGHPSPSKSVHKVVYVLPVYYQGPDGALVREFHRRELVDAVYTWQDGKYQKTEIRDLVSRMQLALDDATDPGAVQDRDLSAPWQPRDRALSVSGPTGGVLTIDLPGTEGSSLGRTQQQAELAAQQLVWTATAVQQDVSMGVRILIGGSPGRLFGSYPVGDVIYREKPNPPAPQDPITIGSPAEGSEQTSPVTVSGTACVFEAALSWELLSGSTVVQSGHTMASSGCPTRGSWSVTVDNLAPGHYTFRAYAPPASGEGAAPEDTRSFDVR